MDWSNFSEQVTQAVMILVATGAVGAAAVELAKAIIAQFGGKLGASRSAILSAIISGGLCAATMIQQAANPVVAICATLVALYAPQAVYNAGKALHLSVNAEAPTDTSGVM